MNDHKHIIVINGRRYNASTGENLSHPVQTEPAINHQAPSHKPAVSAHKPPPKATRQPVHYVAAHAPKRTRTLMRQSVQKPPASLKRRIRVQGHLASQVEPVHETPTRITLGHHAGSRHKAAGGRIIISHFSPDLFTTVKHVPAMASEPTHAIAEPPQPTMKPAFAATPKHSAKPAYKAVHRKPLTTAELLEYVVQSANMPAEEYRPAHARHKPHRKLLKRHDHAAAAR